MSKEYSYENVNKWVEKLAPQLIKDNIGLVLSLRENGIFPGLVVSQHLNKPLSFLKTNQTNVFLPPSTEIQTIVTTAKNKEAALLCLDTITEHNKQGIMESKRLLNDFGVACKLLVIDGNYTQDLRADYQYQDSEIMQENTLQHDQLFI